MSRGIDVDIHLRPGVEDEEFVASALANLAAWRLAAEREERLDWQVLRVDGSHDHHYRLVVRHTQRLLDIGARSDLARILENLSNEDIPELRRRLSAAKSEGLQVVSLRRIREDVDFWRDDFWNWIG